MDGFGDGQVDILIVNYNSTDMLLDCLASLHARPPGIDVHIHVYDNASGDGVERVRQRFPGTHLIRGRRNIGFARAVNRLMRRSRSPFVMLLNPDTLVTRGLLPALLQEMARSPQAGILGPRILDASGAVQGSARAYPTAMTAFFGRTSFLTKLFPGNRFSRRNILCHLGDGRRPAAVDWVSGACMLIRRQAIDQIGTLDERFFLYWEDADLCRRMWRSGWRVLYCPGALVVHHVGGSSRHVRLASVCQFHRSAWHLYRKYAARRRMVTDMAVISALAMRMAGVCLLQAMRAAIQRR